MDRQVVDEVTAFVQARYPALLRLAYLMAGDRGRAEDLVQSTLVKTALAWHRLRRDEGVEAYVRRTLVNTFISAQRRRAWWELPTSTIREPDLVDPYDSVDQRDLLRRALARLPARQRAAVVLRHYTDLSEQQTADAMGCTVGTVKTLTSRALRSLRDDLTAAEPAPARKQAPGDE